MSDIIGNIASANIDGQVSSSANVNGNLYPKGEKGDPGNGITSITKTGTSGLVDTYTILFDDETTTTFTVTNGQNGTNGADGKGLEFDWQGTQLGVRVEGSSQYTYVDLKGQDGHTPVKGTDYFTSAEIASIESDILSQVDLSNYYNKTETDTLLGAKQDSLVSGTNIKTINNTSVLGSGNISIEGESETIVSSTEPTTDRKKVWLRHTKNLVDMTASTSKILISDAGARNSNSLWNLLEKYVKVDGGKKYVVSLSAPSDYQFNIYEYSASKTFIQRQQYLQTSSSNVFTLNSNTEYVMFGYRNDLSITNIQFEIGETATPYEPYVSDKTYILNNNNVYEEFKEDVSYIQTYIDKGLSFRFERIGNLVELSISGRINQGVSSSTNVDIAIDTIFTPSIQKSQLVSLQESTSKIFTVILLPTGTLRWRCNAEVASNGYFVGNIMYLL